MSESSSKAKLTNEELFAKYIDNSIAFISSKSKQLYFFRQDIKDSVPYLRAIHSTCKSKDSYKEFVQAIDEDYKRISQKLQLLNINTLDTYLKYLSAKYFSDHIDEFAKREYDRNIKPSDNIFDILKYDFNNCLNQYANDVLARHSRSRVAYEELIKSDKKASQIAGMQYLTNTEKIDKFGLYLKKEQGKLDPTKREQIISALTYLRGPIPIIRADIKDYDTELRDVLSNSLIELIKFSKETGYYEKHKTQEKFQFKQYDLDSYINGSIEITNNPSALDNLSITELFILTSFWQNRATKELSNYSKALFTLFDLDIVEKALVMDDPLDGIDDETLRNILIKFSFLNAPTNEYYKRIYNNMQVHPERYLDSSNNSITLNTSRFVERTDKNFSEYYNDFFNRNLNRTNTDLRKDIEYYSFLMLPILASYRLKSDILLAPAATQFDKMGNAGIVIDDSNFLQKLQDYKNSNNLLLFGIDGKFSFPAFIHMKYQDLTKFYFSYNGTEKVPIYIGQNDFKNHFGVRLSPQIITPISNKQNQEIKKLAKRKNLPEEDKCLYQHLYYLANHNYHPDHFKGVENLYLDFSDNNIYQRQKDGSYTLVDIGTIKDNPAVFSPIATPNYSRTKNDNRYNYRGVEKFTNLKNPDDDDIDR